MQHFIDVILPIPLDRFFTYSISEAEANFLKPGMRVAVPFGKSKIYTALVHKIHNNAPTLYEAKEIHQILDETPVVTEIQLKHWKWIAEYYMCTIGEVFRTAIPSPLLLESETQIVKSEEPPTEDIALTDDEFLIVEALQHQSLLKLDEVSSILDKKTILPVVNSLLKKEYINVKEEIYQKYKPKLVRYVKLNEKHSSEAALHDLLDTLNRAPKQKTVVLSLFSLAAETKKPITVADVIKRSDASSTTIKALIDKGILEEYFIKTDRLDFSNVDGKAFNALNEFQEQAYKEIEEVFKEKDVALLHGVTSSGKTEIYIKLIEEKLKCNEQVLYLVPEIALTTQLISRLQQFFGASISVYHSKFSQNERVEVWHNVLASKPKAQLVLGTRSSLFLPFTNLGLIVVDEEHEPTYKQQDPAPRYHARDAAIVLANYHKAKTLLGTATPAIETYNNTQIGKYGLVWLTRRHGNVLLPEIELVDIKEKTRKKRMNGHFSDRLYLEIEETLTEGEQVILFQNRRGFAPVVECTTCGHTPQCPNCDVSLTYHQYKKQLRCHYCGYHAALPSHCWSCNSNTLDTKGFGTEQIETELASLFPDASVARMDLDTTRGKHAYEKILTSFEQQEIDILVGTQMLTKGLDFRNVRLVGVMNADNLLNFPDFRAHERTFQLLQQVAGRAGRTKKRGKVLIQTYNPLHQILQQVSTNDYLGMFTDQLNERHQYKYPPVNRMIKITFKDRDFNKLNDGALWFYKSLYKAFGSHVLGPVEPPVSRIRNKYIKNVLVKIPKDQPLKHCKLYIKKVHKSFEAIAGYKSIRVIYHVDYF
jgi:primosomal protein N' (replication factor Y)